MPWTLTDFILHHVVYWGNYRSWKVSTMCIVPSKDCHQNIFILLFTDMYRFVCLWHVENERKWYFFNFETPLMLHVVL
jgi:hypothetical protein